MSAIPTTASAIAEAVASRQVTAREVLEETGLTVTVGPLIEVFDRIPPPGSRTPFGPHTHVLPKLLRQARARGRSHSAGIPVPAGEIPVLSLYPPHPAKNGLGEPRSFDAARHTMFQSLLGQYGDGAAWRAKCRVVDALRDFGVDDLQMPLTPFKVWQTIQDARDRQKKRA
mgnify:CR=1 FL=1